ncbi:MAG: hypothetical protein AAB972_03885, partial [Patescibacteria group bacterium]
MIALSPERHTKEYNKIKADIKELKRKIDNKESPDAIIVTLNTDADEFETLYIQDMRNASTEITKQVGE